MKQTTFASAAWKKTAVDDAPYDAKSRRRIARMERIGESTVRTATPMRHQAWAA